LAEIEYQQPLRIGGAANVDRRQATVIGAIAGVDKSVACQRRGLGQAERREKKDVTNYRNPHSLGELLSLHRLVSLIVGRNIPVMVAVRDHVHPEIHFKTRVRAGCAGGANNRAANYDLISHCRCKIDKIAISAEIIQDNHQLFPSGSRPSRWKSIRGSR
jgi:hypothetical protein